VTAVTETVTVRHPWLGAADLFVGAATLGGVWVALPMRWWPVDVGGTLLATFFVVSGFGLLTGARWSRRVGVILGAVSLAMGLALLTALALSASQLVGLYGPVGRGGALILAAVGLLVAPYLVMLPVAQLVTLRAR
jgi:L-aminopeptidase/D-esterase-like protein